MGEELVMRGRAAGHALERRDALSFDAVLARSEVVDSWTRSGRVGGVCG